DGASKKPTAVPAAANGEEKKAPTLPSPASGGGTTASAVEVTEGAELLARAKGIDLATVKGSGPGGSVRRRDVAEAIERQQTSTLPALAKEEDKKAHTLPGPAQSTNGRIRLIGEYDAMFTSMEECVQYVPVTIILPGAA